MGSDKEPKTYTLNLGLNSWPCLVKISCRLSCLFVEKKETQVIISNSFHSFSIFVYSLENTPGENCIIQSCKKKKLEELITTLVYSWLKTISLLFSLWKFYYNTGIDPQPSVLDLLLALISSLHSWRLPSGKKKTQVIHYCCSCWTVSWHQWMMLKPG